MNKKYLETINNFQHCQRNWDLTKKVPDKLIDFFFEVGYNVPTKQNLNSFTIVCVKTRENIADWSSIARNSNDTLLHSAGSYISDKVNNGGLQNPQTNANLLFLFFINDSERYSELRKKREGGDDPTSRKYNQLIKLPSIFPDKRERPPAVPRGVISSTKVSLKGKTASAKYALIRSFL